MNEKKECIRSTVDVKRVDDTGTRGGCLLKWRQHASWSTIIRIEHDVQKKRGRDNMSAGAFGGSFYTLPVSI